MTPRKPFLPVATLSQILAFRPDDPATHTPSPLVNAVAEALYTTGIIQCKDLAEYLCIDKATRLSDAMVIETGMTLQDLIQNYRIHQTREYLTEHPDAELEEVAHAVGYSSAGTLWRLFQRELGETPHGRKSAAGPENWALMRAAIRRRRR